MREKETFQELNIHFGLNERKDVQPSCIGYL